jgi:hypothetical protein
MLRSVLEEMSVGLVMTAHAAERQAQTREDRGDARGYGVALHEEIAVLGSHPRLH